MYFTHLLSIISSIITLVWASIPTPIDNLPFCAKFWIYSFEVEYCLSQTDFSCACKDPSNWKIFVENGQNACSKSDYDAAVQWGVDTCAQEGVSLTVSTSDVLASATSSLGVVGKTSTSTGGVASTTQTLGSVTSSTATKTQASATIIGSSVTATGTTTGSVTSATSMSAGVRLMKAGGIVGMSAVFVMVVGF